MPCHSPEPRGPAGPRLPRGAPIIVALLLGLLLAGQTSDGHCRGEERRDGSAASQRYEIHDIRGDVVGFMAQHLDPAAGELEVEVLYPRHPVTLPAGAIQARVHPVGRAARLGRRTFRLQLSVDGRAVDTIKVVADLTVRTMVVTPVRMIRPQETIAAGDVVLSEITLRKTSHDFLQDVAQAVGKRAVRPLRANAPIVGAAVSLPHLVKKGQRVTIAARRAGLTVQTIGLSHSAGSLGDRLTVTNIDSNRQVQARVVGAGVVEVDF